MSLVYLFFIISISCCLKLSSCISYKVDVTIHYEFICPHSRSLIIEQAIPSWRKLSKIMNLELVPYGNTKVTLVDNSTMPPSVHFKCQHGKKECDGNILTTCVLELLPPQYSFAFIECMYQHKNWWKPSVSATECAKDLKLDWNCIYQCGDSCFGRSLQWELARKVQRINPKFTYVPWIIINGMHTEDFQRRAFKNMMQLVCDTYQGLKPDICDIDQIDDVLPTNIGYTYDNATAKLSVLPSEVVDYKIKHGMSVMEENDHHQEHDIHKKMTRPSHIDLPKIPTTTPIFHERLITKKPSKKPIHISGISKEPASEQIVEGLTTEGFEKTNVHVPEPEPEHAPKTEEIILLKVFEKTTEFIPKLPQTTEPIEEYEKIADIEKDKPSPPIKPKSTKKFKETKPMADSIIPKKPEPEPKIESKTVSEPQRESEAKPIKEHKSIKPMSDFIITGKEPKKFKEVKPMFNLILSGKVTQKPKFEPLLMTPKELIITTEDDDDDDVTTEQPKILPEYLKPKRKTKRKRKLKRRSKPKPLAPPAALAPPAPPAAHAEEPTPEPKPKTKPEPSIEPRPASQPEIKPTKEYKSINPMSDLVIPEKGSKKFKETKSKSDLTIPEKINQDIKVSDETTKLPEVDEIPTKKHNNEIKPKSNLLIMTEKPTTDKSFFSFFNFFEPKTTEQPKLLTMDEKTTIEPIFEAFTEKIEPRKKDIAKLLNIKETEKDDSKPKPKPVTKYEPEIKPKSKPDLKEEETKVSSKITEKPKLLPELKPKEDKIKLLENEEIKTSKPEVCSDEITTEKPTIVSKHKPPPKREQEIKPKPTIKPLKETEPEVRSDKVTTEVPKIIRLELTKPKSRTKVFTLVPTPAITSKEVTLVPTPAITPKEEQCSDGVITITTKSTKIIIPETVKPIEPTRSEPEIKPKPTLAITPKVDKLEVSSDQITELTTNVMLVSRPAAPSSVVKPKPELEQLKSQSQDKYKAEVEVKTKTKDEKPMKKVEEIKPEEKEIVELKVFTEGTISSNLSKIVTLHKDEKEEKIKPKLKEEIKQKVEKEIKHVKETKEKSNQPELITDITVDGLKVDNKPQNKQTGVNVGIPKPQIPQSQSQQQPQPQSQQQPQLQPTQTILKQEQPKVVDNSKPIKPSTSNSGFFDKIITFGHNVNSEISDEVCTTCAKKPVAEKEAQSSPQPSPQPPAPTQSPLQSPLNIFSFR